MSRPAGEPATGGASATAGAEGDLKAAIARNPGDLEARLDLARVYLGRQDMMGVWRETQEVLAKSPGYPRALAYQSLVRLAMGQADVALDMLKKALRTEPNLLEGYIHLSLVYTRMGRARESDETIAEAIRRFPDQAAMLRQVQEEIKSAPADAAAAPGGENPHERVAPPGSAASAGTPPAEEPPLTDTKAPGGHRVAGVVDLDPALKGQVPAGTVIFVTLREAGFGAGPPIAAKRFLARAFPISFEITDADSMRGDPLPKEVLLEARADSDGDPMTRSPEDPTARQDDVKIGTADVRLVLRKK